MEMEKSQLFEAQVCQTPRRSDAEVVESSRKRVYFGVIVVGDGEGHSRLCANVQVAQGARCGRRNSAKQTDRVEVKRCYPNERERESRGATR